MGKCSSTWLLLLVLLANELAVMRCGEEENHAEKLCETLSIRKPAGSEASTDYSGCISSMTALQNWMEFDIIREIILAFAKPNGGSVGDVERVKTIFTSKSWNDPVSIFQMSQLQKTVKMEAMLVNKYLKPMPLPDLFVLLEKAVDTPEAWWKPHLENKNNYLLLSLIFDKIVEDKTAFSVFEMYGTWAKTDANKKCKELTLREILIFASSQTNKFDAAAFNTIFDFVCVDGENNKSDMWRPNTLEFVFQQPEMKAADLALVKLVLQNCAGLMSELTAAKAVTPNMDWTFQKIIENLRNLPETISNEAGVPKNDVLQHLIKAHIGAFKLNISSAEFDEAIEKCTKKGVGMDVLWHYISELADGEALQTLFKVDCSVDRLVQLLAVVDELEKNDGGGRVLGPFLKAAAKWGLSKDFMYVFLNAMTKLTPPRLEAFAPFINFVCGTSKDNFCKTGTYQNFQITLAMKMFISMNILDGSVFTDLLKRSDANEIKRDVPKIVKSYGETLKANERTIVGLKSYLTNTNIKSCQLLLVLHVIKSAMQGGWEENAEHFTKIYERFCGETGHEGHMIAAITSRSFDETYSSVEACIETNKKAKTETKNEAGEGKGAKDEEEDDP